METVLLPAVLDVAVGLSPKPAAVMTEDGQVLARNSAFSALFPDRGDWWQRRDGDDFEPFLRRPREEFQVEREGRQFRAVPVAVSHFGAEMTCWVLEKADSEAAGEQRARDEFLSMVVHDLRGPAAGIRGTLDFILEDTELHLPEMHRDLLVEARDEAQRMMNLVGEILDFTKIRAGRFRADVHRVRIDLVVRRAVMSVRSLANRERIQVEVDLPKSLAPVAANDDKVMQVLNNLLINAFKFSSAGSLIVVSARERVFSESDRRVLVCVTDTGPGIPFDKQDELFARFSEVGTKTDKKIEGTGLGLFITKAIVEALGGTIAFASIPRIGTSFFFELPAWKEAEREDARG